MKKPAGAANSDVEGSLDATEDSVPVAQGSNAPAPPTAEQQAQLDFLAANHNARKAAYGRMATAVQQYKGPDADAIIKLYNETQAKGELAVSPRAGSSSRTGSLTQALADRQLATESQLKHRRN